MSDQANASSSCDFALDQAGSVSRQHTQQPYVNFDAERDARTADALEMPIQAHQHDTALSFQAFGVHHPLGHLPGYGFSPSAPPGWDWTNSIDFSEFTNQYEPQGELAHELQPPTITNDFSIPLPIAPADLMYQAQQHSQSATPGTNTALNPLSPPPKPPQRPVIQTGMKRKADSESDSAVLQSTADAQQNHAKRQNKSRQSSATSPTTPTAAEPADARQSPMAQTVTAQAASEPAQATTETQRRKEQSKGTGPQGRVIDVSRRRRVVEGPGGPDMLPAGKVFPIQIGAELFRLSGASISSDAPSYFSHFFSEQLHSNGGRAGDVKTLYIDRDPATFRDIALHLQGYHITPKDGEQFVKLFADAQFYSLPRLTKQLFSTDIFIRIGGTPFQIPHDLFSSPGDSPNYFSLGFAQFFSTPSEVFPGLDRSSLLRPPSISPPSAPNRSGETFAELIRILQGYTVKIRNDEHRSQLLRDARYFHLKGLEQRLIPCEISFNLKRHHSEILLRLEDIRQSGVSFTPDKHNSDTDTSSSTLGGSPAAAPSPAPSFTSTPTAKFGFVSYARPYTTDHSATHILILETSAQESCTLYLPATPSPNCRATFHNATLARITSLFSVIASKMGLPATQPLGLMYLQTGQGVAAQPVSPANSGVSERRVRVRLESDCAIELDGRAADFCSDDDAVGIRVDGKWAWGCGKEERVGETEWVVKRAQWRLRVEAVEFEGERRMQVVLYGVKIEAFSVERRRNVERAFLGSA